MRESVEHFIDAELIATVLLSEVVLVSRKGYDDEERWVYLDTGVFGGIAETLDEAIRYRLVSGRHGGPAGPVVLAAPTCDSVDVLYERSGMTSRWTGNRVTSSRF